MMDRGLISAIGMHFLSCVSPGPSTLYLFAILTSNGLKSVNRIILGIACGNAIYISIAVFGLSTVPEEYMKQVHIISSMILMYFGINGIVHFFRRHKSNDKEKYSHKYFIAGFIITMFNPKPILFYQMFLTPIITLYPTTLKIAIALYFTIATFVFIFLEILLMNTLKSKSRKYLDYISLIFSIGVIFFSMKSILF